MVKIWTEVFWKPAPSPDLQAVGEEHRPDRLMLGSTIFLGALIVALGIFASPATALLQRSGH
jgi:formate hydrogenlyase subunit 3/multisubunit Na+/H+ antiporter MnhD subunit